MPLGVCSLACKQDKWLCKSTLILMRRASSCWTRLIEAAYFTSQLSHQKVCFKRWTDATNIPVLVQHGQNAPFKHRQVRFHTHTWQRTICLGLAVMFPASSWISTLKLAQFPFTTGIGLYSGLTWRECGLPEKNIIIAVQQRYQLLPFLINELISFSWGCQKNHNVSEPIVTIQIASFV